LFPRLTVHGKAAPDLKPPSTIALDLRGQQELTLSKTVPVCLTSPLRCRLLVTPPPAISREPAACGWTRVPLSKTVRSPDDLTIHLTWASAGLVVPLYALFNREFTRTLLDPPLSSAQR
jgi:hypothetical protein